MNDQTKYCILDLCKKYEPVFILDVYNYIFRFHFAHKDLSITTEEGQTFLTGHLYGFTKNLLYLKEKFPNCAVVMCVDGHDKERREILPEYKAHREHEINPADDLHVLTSFCSLVDGVYVCYDENYEADDAAASVTRTLKHLCNKFNIDKQIYLLSSDKDWWQLIDDGIGNHCKVATVKKWGLGEKWFTEAEIITEDKVKEEFNGVSPKNLLKFRAITGDTSDNIKGYYRFFKKNAAIIAENFDYDRDNNTLNLKDGVDMRSSWSKFLNTITNDITTFSNNYRVMSLKDFDFTLSSISQNVSEDTVNNILQALQKLKLYYYLSNVGRYSSYKPIIDKFLSQDTQMEEDLKVDTIEANLEDLL